MVSPTASTRPVLGAACRNRRGELVRQWGAPLEDVPAAADSWPYTAPDIGVISPLSDSRR